MNKYIGIICFSLLIILSGSCKKENSGSSSNNLEGSWELRQTSAAMMPAATNYPEGNGNILKFTGSNYEIYRNGQLEKSGQYMVIKDSTVEESVCLVFPDDQFTSRVVYDNDFSAVKVFFQIENDKLTIFSGCYANDAGHSAVYERQVKP